MKVVSYADQGIIDFYDVLLSSWSFQEYNMEALSITNQYKGHYKNRLYLDGDWEYFNASQVGPLSGQFFHAVKKHEFTNKRILWKMVNIEVGSMFTAWKVDTL